MIVDAAPPPGHREVTPRIAVADVVGQVDFLRSVFGAIGDIPSGRLAEMRIGESLVMVGSTFEREPFPAFPVHLRCGRRQGLRPGPGCWSRGDRGAG